MNYALLILYGCLNNFIQYLLGLVVTDKDSESVASHNAYTREYRRIKQFVKFFAESIGDYQLLIKMDYIIAVYKKIKKVRHDDNGNSDIEYMYESTTERLEIYEFVKLFYAREECSLWYRKFYDDCYRSCSEREIMRFYRAGFRLFDARESYIRD